jgi:hypothetical protein
MPAQPVDAWEHFTPEFVGRQRRIFVAQLQRVGRYGNEKSESIEHSLPAAAGTPNAEHRASRATFLFQVLAIDASRFVERPPRRTPPGETAVAFHRNALQIAFTTGSSSLSCYAYGRFVATGHRNRKTSNPVKRETGQTSDI